MRSTLLPVFFLFIHIAQAQIAGRISFEEKIDLHRNIPLEQSHYKNMMPEFNIVKWELTFDGDKSLYQRFIETELKGASANQSYWMRMGKENRVIYKDLKEQKLVDSREFMQKQFLIKGFTTSRKWKIGSNQKNILGYHCLEAYCQLDSVTALKAWFSPQLNISNGPEDYQELPGMILQIDINNGERTITATQIQLDNVDTSVIVPPTKGKEITSHEFEKLREEKIKEISAQRSGSYFMTRRY